MGRFHGNPGLVASFILSGFDEPQCQDSYENGTNPFVIIHVRRHTDNKESDAHKKCPENVPKAHFLRWSMGRSRAQFLTNYFSTMEQIFPL